ncbi:MAG: Ig-like domain repeat protein [Cellulomonas sp.]|nr:Ig-like domain repeat protein [Cellulomonas sp.]
MRFHRIIAGILTAGLLSLAPVAISSPASATVDLATTTTVSTFDTLPIVYGETITLTSDVAGSDGTSAYRGTVTLMVATPSVPTWTTVATGDTTYASFDVHPSTNAAYKVVYSGYAALNTYENNYAASESAPFAVAVKRKATFRTPGLYVVGKIKPDFAHRKVILKRKQGKRYVAWKKIRTNGKGQFRVKAPNKVGFKFSLTIPSDSKFTGFTDLYQVYAARVIG